MVGCAGLRSGAVSDGWRLGKARSPGLFASRASCAVRGLLETGVRRAPRRVDGGLCEAKRLVCAAKWLLFVARSGEKREE